MSSTEAWGPGPGPGVGPTGGGLDVDSALRTDRHAPSPTRDNRPLLSPAPPSPPDRLTCPSPASLLPTEGQTGQIQLPSALTVHPVVAPPGKADRQCPPPSCGTDTCFNIIAATLALGLIDFATS